MRKQLARYKVEAYTFFRNERGEPFVLTDGQSLIWHLVYSKDVPRAAIKTITQYGKSEVASMALIMLMVDWIEKVLLVAPSADQSAIIMSKIIQHLFDHDDLVAMIDYKGRLEQLRRERSKRRITFKNSSEVMMLTADAREITKEAKSLMGFGATTVLVDESALIPSVMFSKILRMVGSNTGEQARKLVQIGNPFEEGHFSRAFESEKYQHLTIDWRQALAEGRVTQEFLDEAKAEMSEMDWQIFYDVIFPRAGSDDAVIPYDWVMLAVNQNVTADEEISCAGLDVARYGRDKTVYIFRQGQKVKRLEICDKLDTMEVVGWVRQFVEDDEPEVLSIDAVGIGAGVVDRLLEIDDLEVEVNGVNVGAAPDDADDKERYANLRAQIWFYVRELFRPRDGKSAISIPNDPELIKELTEMRYKYSSEKKIKIESKDELKKRLGRSPDKADALALAFYPLTESEPALTIG